LYKPICLYVYMYCQSYCVLLDSSSFPREKVWSEETGGNRRQQEDSESSNLNVMFNYDRS